MIFVIEIFVTINTSFIQSETNKYEINRWKITLNYITTWLAIDVVAVLPRFFRLFESEDQQSSTTSLLSILKFARISRIFRILKLVRLLKLLKAAK